MKICRFINLTQKGPSPGIPSTFKGSSRSASVPGWFDGKGVLFSNWLLNCQPNYDKQLAKSHFDWINEKKVKSIFFILSHAAPLRSFIMFFFFPLWFSIIPQNHFRVNTMPKLRWLATPTASSWALHLTGIGYRFVKLLPWCRHPLLPPASPLSHIKIRGAEAQNQLQTSRYQ